jgi:hypothetical protein
LADLAPAFAQNFLFAKDCFAPLAKSAAGGGAALRSLSICARRRSSASEFFGLDILDSQY